MVSETKIKSGMKLSNRVPRGVFIRQYGTQKNFVCFNFLERIDGTVFPEKVVLSQGYYAELITSLEISMIVSNRSQVFCTT